MSHPDPAKVPIIGEIAIVGLEESGDYEGPKYSTVDKEDEEYCNQFDWFLFDMGDKQVVARLVFQHDDILERASRTN